ncbi:MAG: hypothetical protein KC493_00280 [Bacteriovoracaceae bacterium]|nr:hypothetical protein [Bacteriovoracaceae bacterium]
MNWKTERENEREELENFDNLSVALLLPEIEDVKEISDIFRSMGVIPHFYQDLKSFWQGVLAKIPSLAIVDVRNMSEGERLLRNHPFVKSNQLPLCFYYNEATVPLVFSTFEIPNYGLIKKETNLRGQLKSVLVRYNRDMAAIKRDENFKLTQGKLERQVTSLLGATEKFKEENYYHDYLKSIIDRFEAHRDVYDFYKVLEKSFDSIKEVREWALLELSQNGQRLVSPELENDKYKKIPSLWLGQACQSGIQQFAQNMANQIGLDMLGGEIMSLMIRGRHDLPDKVLLVRACDEEFLNNFDWESLELHISGIYCRLLLREQRSVKERESQLVQPWELFSLMDNVNYDSKNVLAADEYTLIDLNFSGLVDFVRDKPSVRFYWQQFITEFFNGFDNQYKLSYRTNCMGVNNIGLVATAENAERVFRSMKAYVSRYPFWKYFEDVDIVLARDLAPKIQVVPFSSDAWMNHVEGKVLHGVRVKSPEPINVEEKVMPPLKEGFFMGFDKSPDL